jgi:hypothetical protein
MPADYTGQYGLPQDVGHPVVLSVEEVNRITQEGFGPSPEEAEAIYQASILRQKEEAEQARLDAMLAEAERANREYYAEGGKGYGTVPGGPDVTYMPSDAPLWAKTTYTALDPFYGEGGVFEPVTDLVTGEGSARENLLLYGAIAIGALALLRR